MTALTHKIDFVALISVTNANPNGDPLNGNRPRENYDGFGEISDVCIKRKIRNRLQDLGQKVFVQSDDRRGDEFKNLESRAKNCQALKEEMEKKEKDRNPEKFHKAACEEWIDVRSFGQVFAFKKNGISIGVRGPVSIHQAVSVSPVDIISMQITKSVNNEAKKDKNQDGDDAQSEGMSSDRMGLKHFVAFGLYVLKGSINCQLAKKTEFSDDDAQLIKKALRTLFDNDASSARPDGSMDVYRLYWWDHKEKTPITTSAQVHNSVKITLKDGVDVPRSVDDYEITLINPEKCEKPTLVEREDVLKEQKDL